MSYTVRELRQYLARHEIAENNCTEKADLVELIVCMNGAAAEGESAEHRRHVEILRLAQVENTNKIELIISIRYFSLN